jgi:hypothetical protein
VLIIILDDVGFGHAGTFGGAVATPTLDRLAAGGLRYNHFHTTALCSPTRGALVGAHLMTIRSADTSPVVISWFIIYSRKKKEVMIMPQPTANS